MASTIDPMNRSIDSVIQWLREERRLRPGIPLSELVDLSALPLDRLVDLACIDLIERKRLGQPTTVEDVLRDLPSLATDDSFVLDLIDAELCVVIELGPTIDMAEYAMRFPELFHAIQALVKLDGGLTVQPPVSPTDPTSLAGPTGLAGPTSLAGPTGLTGQTVKSRQHAGADKRHDLGSRFGIDQLIEPPPWFTREQIQCISDRSYLIRGRDSNEKRSVALKVIKLTHAISKREIESMLSAVEAASSVRHPAWVTPDVAAVENNALAVIRPWIFGTRWDQARRHASLVERLRDLARIGYALQAAHDTTSRNGHAAHGGLHLNNLVVDAEGQIKILDAAACIQPAAGDIFGSRLNEPPVHLASDCLRRQSDVRSLCALVRMAIVSVEQTKSELNRQIAILDKQCETLIASPEQPAACAQLADTMMKLTEGNLVEQGSGSFVTTAKTIWRKWVDR